MQYTDFDYIVVGAGLSGAAAARCLADGGKQVLVLERNSHVAGSVYDTLDEAGILIHLYGPHIFHTHYSQVWDFVSRFTEFIPYEHKVLGRVGEAYFPIPFNLNSLESVFDEQKSTMLREKLLAQYGADTRISIRDLQQADDPQLQELAQYVYDNVFAYYTAKQWGISPDAVDTSVISRVPVAIDRRDTYFTDQFQGMPTDGYTTMVESMLNHDNIQVVTGTDADSYLKPQLAEGKLEVPVIYTGAIDELFDRRHGRLPYRTVRFDFETLNMDKYQPAATVNYTVSEDFTRITEFKQLTGQQLAGKTTILREYPLPYEGKPGQAPYYPIKNEENFALYDRYVSDAKAIQNLHPLGRLARYRYLDMDDAIFEAMELANELLNP